MKPITTLALLFLSFLPRSASAYAVLGPGELERMDALLAWQAGEEVLVLSPVVRGGGVLVVPLPEGTRLLPPLDLPLDALGLAAAASGGASDGTSEAASRRRSGAASGGAGGVVGPETVAPEEMPAGTLRALEKVRSLRSIERRTPPLVRARKALLVPADRLSMALQSMGVAEPATRAAALGLESPMVLVVALPRDPEGARLAPVGLAFRSRWPRLPLLSGSKPALSAHPLALRVVLEGPARDLGGMDFLFGLRRAGATSAPSPRLLAWLEPLLPASLERLRVTPLIAATFEPARGQGQRFGDLRLPPPPGARTEAHAGASKSTANDERPAGGEGCHGCMVGASGRPVAALFVSLLVVASLGVRRR